MRTKFLLVINTINVILKDMPNTTRARISDRPVVNRAKVLVGNSLKLVENNLKDDETYYIDEGKLYIIKQFNFLTIYSNYEFQ